MTTISIDFPFSAESRIAQSADAIAAEVSGEIVLLHSATGYFHQLNPVGSYLWKQIAQPRTIGELSALATADFDGDEETCRRDITVFVIILRGLGLVRLDP